MIEILTLNEADKWNYFLDKLPIQFQDIYYTPEYYSIYEKSGYGKAMCFVQSIDMQILIYPFLFNEIKIAETHFKEKYFDIQGAYGYNGLLCNTNDDSFINKFIDSFADFCNKKNIIAEFTRFNPVLHNEKITSQLEIVYDQENIVLDLKSDNIEIYEYEYSTRKNIKKALRSGLKNVVFSGVDITNEYFEYFYAIYNDTMDRNNADDFYYFTRDYFHNIISSIPNNCKFYFVIMNSKVISTELVLYGKSVAYSFLGGTLSDYFEFRPNDFLKDLIIKDLIIEGKEYFCLGGGPDGVIRYKKTFAKNGTYKFYFGKKIHNQDIYNKIINIWEIENPISSKIHSSKVLKYYSHDKTAVNK